MTICRLNRPLSLSIGLLVSSLLLVGCAGTSSQKKLLEADESQVKLRSIQTRAFDTTDKEKMLRTIIGTLQDLNFVIQKADVDLGTVTGNKFVNNQVLVMSVTVRPRGEKQLLVRANAQYGITAIEDPSPYQDFFNALEKSIFLTAQQVE